MRKCRLPLLFLLLGLLLSACQPPQLAQYGFAREVPEAEAQKRLQFVSEAEKWLDANEFDGSHKPIIDIYNGHEPLAQGYTVKYTDKWCATFVSAIAISCGFTDIIPTECGCQRQIGLFEALGRWEENDAYVPLPGDIIYYCQEETEEGDCTGWSDHVGIVVGTSDNKIKVIEGNYIGRVSYRYIEVDDPSIRGYALPDYSYTSEEDKE